MPAALRDRLGLWAAVAITFVATLTLAIALGHAYTPLTIFDEGVHFDYIVKLLDTGRLPVVASTMSPETLKEISCRGAIWLAELRCANPLSNAETPIGGVNYVLMYPPIYYGPVLAIAGPLSAISGLSLFVASRVATAIFFSAGAALITAALVRLRVNRVVAICVTLMVSVSPAFLFQGSTVTPDSFALLAGGGALFIASLRVSWRRRLIIATVVAILIALTKPNFVPLATFTVLIAAIFPVQNEVDSRARWFERGIQRVLLSIGLAVLPLLAALGWNAIRTASLPEGTRADGGLNDMLITEQSLLAVIAEGVRILTSPFTVGTYTNSGVMSAAQTLVQFVMIGGALVVALTGALSARGGARTMSFMAVGSLALSMVYLPLTFYVLYHSTGTQARYAMPVVPLFAATLAMVIDTNRVVRIVLVGLTTLYWLGTLSTIVRLG
jgi:hypothetical protein